MIENIEQLKDAGADRVLMPYADAAAEAVDKLFGQVKQTASGSITVDADVTDRHD